MAKVAGNAEEAARLQREADQLEAARHPGVVELVGVEGHGVGAILLTAHVDGPVLAQLGRLPIEESAGLLAALASTLADLHELGLVHGAVSPAHVIVGPGGRPILCGFGYGGRVGQPVGPGTPVPRAFADPARDDADQLHPAVDIFAIGALARFLVPDPPAGHVLARVADEATSEDVSSRPSARVLAQSIHHGVPAARLPRALEPRPAARPPTPAADPLAALRHGPDRAGRTGRRPQVGTGRRPKVGIVAGAVAAVVVVGAAIVLAGSTTPPAPAAEFVAPPEMTEPGPTTTRARPVTSMSTPASTPATRPAPATPTTVSITAIARRGDCLPVTAVLQADVDGDGCPDGLRYADGVLDAAGMRWSIGQAGDQMATGDWACQGSRTLVLFRPSTGEVFRFGGWAVPGQDLTATVAARVQGGLALRAADIDRDGCHEVVIERATGTAEVVRLARLQP